jgi:hypothetical protein
VSDLCPLADRDRWQQTDETATRALSVEQRRQTIEHDVGLDLGR